MLQTHTHTEKHKYSTVFSTFTDELDNSRKLNSLTPIGENDDRWLTEPETPAQPTIQTLDHVTANNVRPFKFKQYFHTKISTR